MSLSDLSFNWDLRWNMPCFVSWFDEDWSFPIVSPWYILIVSYVSYICHFLCITIYNIPILLIYWLYTVYIYPHSKSPLKYECWHPHADWRGLPSFSTMNPFGQVYKCTSRDFLSKIGITLNNIIQQNLQKSPTKRCQNSRTAILYIIAMGCKDRFLYRNGKRYPLVNEHSY